MKHFILVILAVLGEISGHASLTLATGQHAKVGVKPTASKGIVRLNPSQQEKLKRLVLSKTRHSTKEWMEAKLILKHSSASEFSGALHWAHKDKIMGDGVTIGVVEVGGRSCTLVPDSSSGFLDASLAGDSHSIAVVDVIRQIAPDSHIVVDNYNNIFSFPSSFEPIEIINDSNGCNRSSGYADYLKPMRSMERLLLNHGKQKLLITASGNYRGEILKDKQAYATIFGRNLIIVGNLEAGYEQNQLSNEPSIIYKDCFIWTLGTDVVALNSEKGTEHFSGTSFAAPIVSGVLALLRQKYPHFTIYDLREVLLESAERTFFRSIDLGGPGSFMNYIYDLDDGPLPQEFVGQRRIEYRINGKMHYIVPLFYEPKTYGKGILSVRNAFIYAELKNSHSDWSPKDLRRAMLDRVRQQEERAASLIQNKWRERYSKKVQAARTIQSKWRHHRRLHTKNDPSSGSEEGFSSKES